MAVPDPFGFVTALCPSSLRGALVAGRIPLVIPPNDYNRFYLMTKASRSGHYIDFDGKEHLTEQGEPVLVDGMNGG